MTTAVIRSAHTLEEMIAICERLYERDGFVQWAEVGKALGVTRQAVQLRFRAAVAKGQVSKELVEKYQSMTAKHAVAAQNRTKGREVDKLRIHTVLTPENKKWLQAEAVVRRVRTSDIVNGLIQKAREAG